jgi:hypothetical protein
VTKDDAKALEWLEKAAAKDDAGAMTLLGTLYQNGRGVSQDYAKASEWFAKAAAKDVVEAMTNLGLLYENGDGLPKDYTKAREWYEKAAGKSDAGARAHLELLTIREQKERQARPAAEAEMKRMKEQAEQQRLAALRADEERTKAAAAAEAKRKAEEAEQQRFANLDSRSLCGQALNGPKSGWDQNPYYATHVTEASRRGLTVDSCRRLVEAAGALPVTTASNSLFTIRRGVEATGLGIKEVFSSLSIEDCEQKCAQQSTCNVYTYSSRIGSGACFLYTRADFKPNANFDSGIKK